MAKSVKINWQTIGLVVGLGFAWSKLGLGAAVKEIGIVWPKPPSRQEAGYLSQAEWEAKGYGFGSKDYNDWLLGR